MGIISAISLGVKQMNKFKVGNKNKATSEKIYGLDEAYQVAVDGDVLELQGGQTIEFNSLSIAKNLTITSDELDPAKYPVIQGQLSIDPEAEVKIEKIKFINDAKDKSSLAINRAKVDLSEVFFDSDNTSQANYYTLELNKATVNIDRSKIKGLVNLVNESELLLDNSELLADIKQKWLLNAEKSSIKLNNSKLAAGIRANDAASYRLTSSKLEANNATFTGQIWASDKSVLRLSGSKVQTNTDAVAILLDKSKLALTNSELISNQRTALKVINLSTVSLEKTVLTPGAGKYDLIAEDSIVKLNDEELSYLYFARSDVEITSATIQSLQAQDHSAIQIEDVFFSSEHDSKWKNFTLKDHSILIAKKIRTDIRDLYAELKTGSYARIGQVNRLPYLNDTDPESTIEIAQSPEVKTDVFTLGDQRDAMETLNNLVGLGRVKEQIKTTTTLIKFNKIRKASGLKNISNTLHAVFLGNPGTGKTTVARLYAKILFDAGVLPGEEFKFVEAGREDLVGKVIGESAQKTAIMLERAKGGVLFIDEAYALNVEDSSNDFGHEVITQILKYMENHRDEIAIIFAGYTEEMQDFLESNPGLDSRIPNKFYFDDYSPSEIVQITKDMLEDDQVYPEDEEYFAKRIANEYSNAFDAGNARWSRNMAQGLELQMAKRIADHPDQRPDTLINADIDELINQGNYIEGSQEDAYEKLQNLIGLKRVKEQIDEFISMALINKKRQELGYEASDYTLHSLFLGNPGTGKTTVARLMGKVLYQKGVIRRDKFVEVTRADLVGKYVGHTAQLTRKVLKSALGGVLFVDEAYDLAKKESTGSDFGQEAVTEILKFMEDHRHDLVIIFAGYYQEMADFMDTNTGLKSRIPNKFDFEDYDSDAIVKIGLQKLAERDYQVDPEKYAALVKVKYQPSTVTGNGRWVQVFNDRLSRIQADRVTKDLDHSDILQITDEDLAKMAEVN